jgi:5'-3' exonuclease
MYNSQTIFLETKIEFWKPQEYSRNYSPFAMGIRGLYSSLKQYSIPIHPEEEDPLHIGIDTYALFYRFKENFNELFRFIESLCVKKHTPIFVLDGVPPPEKQQELAARKQQRKEAQQQAESLRAFLQQTNAEELSESSRKVIEKKIQEYENECWTVYRALRERFVEEAKGRGFEVRLSKGEADDDLLRMALSNEVQVVLANDMDYFVGGVERLWIFTKDLPAVREFQRIPISKTLGVHPTAWRDVALLAGYEKAQNLRRMPASHAISLLHIYGDLETLFEKRKDLFQDVSLEEYKQARRFFE